MVADPLAWPGLALAITLDLGWDGRVRTDGVALQRSRSIVACL